VKLVVTSYEFDEAILSSGGIYVFFKKYGMLLLGKISYIKNAFEKIADVCI